MLLLTRTCRAKLHIAPLGTRRGDVLTSQCCRLGRRSTLNPSCSIISEEKVLLADINYPSLMKTDRHTSSFYAVVVAGKLRQGRLAFVSLQLPPQAHILAIPSPESKPRTVLPALHWNTLRLEIPQPCGFLGIETSSKGRSPVVKVKSIATEM